MKKKKKHTDSGFSQTSVLRNIHLKFKRTKKEEIKDKWGWICTSYPPEKFLMDLRTRPASSAWIKKKHTRKKHHSEDKDV